MAILARVEHLGCSVWLPLPRAFWFKLRRYGRRAAALALGAWTAHTQASKRAQVRRELWAGTRLAEVLLMMKRKKVLNFFAAHARGVRRRGGACCRRPGIGSSARF